MNFLNKFKNKLFILKTNVVVVGLAVKILAGNSGNFDRHETKPSR